MKTIENITPTDIISTNLAVEQLPVLRNEINSSELVELDGLAAQQLQAVKDISASVSLTDTVSTNFFAAPPLKRLSDQLDKTLSGVRNDEVGLEGTNIILSVRKDFALLRLEDVKKEIMNGESLLASLPIIGKYFSAFKRMRALHEPVIKSLDKTKQDAEILLGKLKTILNISDRQYQMTEDAIDEVSIWIAGGQQAWLRMRDEFRNECENSATSKNIKRLSKLREMAESLDSFAATLVELRIAHMGFIASLPQIRMTEKAARIEVQNTLRTIFLDLPRIKQAVRTMASLRQISEAGKASKAQKQMSQDLSKLSADMTGVVYKAALASEGDFDSSIQSVDYVINTVVKAIDEGLVIREQNIEKREVALQAMNAAHDKFVASLRSSSNRGLIR